MDRDEISDDFDKEVVELAALFHDIGRAEDIEDRKMSPFEGHEGHGKRGAESVHDYIGDLVDDETLEHVKNIIRNHVDSEPESLEGKLVQDADLLFKFGVHDFWRGFHYASENHEDIEERLEYIKQKQLLRKKKEKEKLQYDISKDIAARRIEEREETMKQLEMQLRGADIADFSE
jgi:HD superfamily phosphodiesterase